MVQHGRGQGNAVECRRGEVHNRDVLDGAVNPELNGPGLPHPGLYRGGEEEGKHHGRVGVQIHCLPVKGGLPFAGHRYLEALAHVAMVAEHDPELRLLPGFDAGISRRGESRIVDLVDDRKELAAMDPVSGCVPHHAGPYADPDLPSLLDLCRGGDGQEQPSRGIGINRRIIPEVQDPALGIPGGGLVPLIDGHL